MVGLVLALWLACFGANADVARTPITYMSLAYGLPAGSIFSDFQSELIETDHSWRAQFNTLFDPPPSMVDAFSPSVVLARKQLPNRYAYASWLGVHSGFGQIFAGDRIGRSRICGAGLEDACCLFLKMSFRF
jgi:hypothetical protein